jgi:L-alanine-DL-glutamate epimerase-like enolase superfamily enzyme
MQIECNRVTWPYISPFRIAYRAQISAQAVRVTLRDGGFMGRGEAQGVSYHGETLDSMLAQVSSLSGEIARGITRGELQSLLPPGGARNALDCALWDLEAKRAGKRAWEIAGMNSIATLVTAYTLSLDAPESMALAATTALKYVLLKLKLGGDGADVDRVAAVRAARPDVRIIADANQSWNERQLSDLVPRLASLGVELIEQPLPAGSDCALAEYESLVPLCADESCQTRSSLPSVIGKYQFINIKLDKAGGLTEALELARQAQTHDLKLMVGCMAGSSLSMAPAFVVGQLCSIIDLDGPLLAAADVPNPIQYEGSRMYVPPVSLWG